MTEMQHGPNPTFRHQITGDGYELKILGYHTTDQDWMAGGAVEWKYDSGQGARRGPGRARGVRGQSKRRARTRRTNVTGESDAMSAPYGGSACLTTKDYNSARRGAGRAA